MGLVYVTDWNPKGSGYFSIGASLVPALANLTEFRNESIVVLGINYQAQEYHQTDFAIVPTQFDHVPARIDVLLKDEELHLDKVVVALDLTLQMQVLTAFPRNKRPFRYAGIFPLDGGPLVREWAMVVGEMNEAFAISKFAQRCCENAGLEVNYLPMGAGGWFVHADPEFVAELKGAKSIEGKFIILTVADNQERKNLAGAMQMVTEFSKMHPNIEYWMVTRPQSMFGWQLESLARDLGIRHITHFFDRNLDPQEMFILYCCADVLLLTPKAEGLGMPVLEAQMTGQAIPVVTRTSALVELIEQGGGLFIEPDYHWIDPFGNTERVFPSIVDGIKKLEMIYNASPDAIEWMREFGRRFMGQKTWDKAAEIFWDVMDRNNPSTVGIRDRAPWIFGGEDLQSPSFEYEHEYRGR